MDAMPKGIQSLLGAITLLKPEEKLLIITDDQKFEIGHTLYQWASQVYDTTLCVMPPRAAHGAEPTDLIAGAMLQADVVFVATTMSMFHSRARRAAVQTGHTRYVNMVDYIPQMFYEGGLTADFEEITRVLDRICPHFQGSIFELTAPGGTHLICGVEGRPAIIDYGRSFRAGQSSSPPNAEIALGPVEGTANGVIVVDGSIPHPLINLLEEPITLRVKDGSITEITGGRQADIFREILAAYNDERVYNIGELGLPVNPLNKVCGLMLVDEGAYGTLHIGIGNNLSFGGHVEAPVHIDLVIRDVTCKIDGREISRDGELQV